MRRRSAQNECNRVSVRRRNGTKTQKQHVEACAREWKAKRSREFCLMENRQSRSAIDSELLQPQIPPENSVSARLKSSHTPYCRQSLSGMRALERNSAAMSCHCRLMSAASHQQITNLSDAATASLARQIRQPKATNPGQQKRTCCMQFRKHLDKQLTAAELQCQESRAR